MLFRGRWLIGHLVVLVTSASFVALGIWQYGRHLEKQDAQRDARAEYAAPAPDLLEIAETPASAARVSASGTYDPDGEVLLRNRVRGGDSGFAVVTPLVLTDGTAVLVDRGWVSRGDVARGLPDLTTPDGPVTVRGTLQQSRQLDAGDPVEERADRATYPRVDAARIGAQLPYDVRESWITAQWQDPAPGATGPALPDPPDTDDVNHLSYAFQWMAFAAIPLVGWPIVLARRFRTRRR